MSVSSTGNWGQTYSHSCCKAYMRWYLANSRTQKNRHYFFYSFQRKEMIDKYWGFSWNHYHLFSFYDLFLELILNPLYCFVVTKQNWLPIYFKMNYIWWVTVAVIKQTMYWGGKVQSQTWEKSIMKTGPQFVCHTGEENMQDLKEGSWCRNT